MIKIIATTGDEIFTQVAPWRYVLQQFSNSLSSISSVPNLQSKNILLKLWNNGIQTNEGWRCFGSYKEFLLTPIEAINLIKIVININEKIIKCELNESVK